MRKQTAKCELILLDNRGGRFKSAAEALNEGGSRATGDYIMFVHQDICLATDSWLKDVESILNTLPTLGVAGVAGVSENGRNWYERMSFSISGQDNEKSPEHGCVRLPEEVQTLDECVLIVPRSVFDRLRFDESVFDGWDCYGADYCLSAREMGLKVYVVPAPCDHCCSRAHYPIWHFKDLLTYQRRLYRKHKGSYGRIYTWMGTVSCLNLKVRSFICLIGPFYVTLFPYLQVYMKRELAGCHTVVDLGCGSSSPLVSCDVPYSVGVELFEPSLLASRKVGIHSEYVLADVTDIAFKPKSFDAVVAIEVLEHLTKEEGTALLRRMEQWAKKKIMISTPNGFIWQDPYDDNPSQEHQTGWKPRELRELGFKVRGLGGWKQLKGYRGRFKYQPAFLWARVSDLTQPLAYHFPEIAFQLIATKRLDKSQI